MPKPYNTRTFAHLKTQQTVLARRLRALRAASETQDGFGTTLSTTARYSHLPQAINPHGPTHTLLLQCKLLLREDPGDMCESMKHSEQKQVSFAPASSLFNSFQACGQKNTLSLLKLTKRSVCFFLSDLLQPQVELFGKMFVSWRGVPVRLLKEFGESKHNPKDTRKSHLK